MDAKLIDTGGNNGPRLVDIRLSGMDLSQRRRYDVVKTHRHRGLEASVEYGGGPVLVPVQVYGSREPPIRLIRLIFAIFGCGARTQKYRGQKTRVKDRIFIYFVVPGWITGRSQTYSSYPFSVV